MAATTALLVAGMRQSASANNAMVALKLVVLLLFVVVGALPSTPRTGRPFLPAYDGSFGDFGISGLVRGAGVIFFAYVGFDAVSTAAGESRNPQRTVPIGLLATVIISTRALRRDRAGAHRPRALRASSTSPTRCPWRSSARAPASSWLDEAL